MRILELSRKIYDAGFEPDFIYFIYSEHEADNLKQWLLYPEKDFREDGLSEYIPYFSADWCWNILPFEIVIDKVSCLKSVCGQNVGYADVNEYHFSWIKVLLITDIERPGEYVASLHEALLEMVCWCIDNGYIKKEVRE